MIREVDSFPTTIHSFLTVFYFWAWLGVDGKWYLKLLQLEFWRHFSQPNNRIFLSKWLKDKWFVWDFPDTFIKTVVVYLSHTFSHLFIFWLCPGILSTQSRRQLAFPCDKIWPYWANWCFHAPYIWKLTIINILKMIS